jgi:hypothetical protein
MVAFLTGSRAEAEYAFVARSRVYARAHSRKKCYTYIEVARSLNKKNIMLSITRLDLHFNKLINSCLQMSMVIYINNIYMDQVLRTVG